MSAHRRDIRAIRALADAGTPFTMVTAYDYTSAQFVDRADIPLILVGDSMGNVVQGRDTTLPVTVEHIAYHTQCVARGSAKALIVADLPFLSYSSSAQAFEAARTIMGTGACQSVKLEGGAAVAPVVADLVTAGVPVMGHVGFTPQSQHQIGLRVQARERDAADTLMADCAALQEAGAWAIVLELIPDDLARRVTDLLDVPTIGIGAGPHCSGQVQVWHDILGLFDDYVPKHTRRFAKVGDSIVEALGEYRDAVAAGEFPQERS